MGPAPVYAPQGQMIAGFPTGLILDHNVKATNSYAINYSSSTNLYVVQWDSSSSVAALYNAYLAYLPANGWTITNRFTDRPDLRGFYAVNNLTSANVNITIRRIGQWIAGEHWLRDGAIKSRHIFRAHPPLGCAVFRISVPAPLCALRDPPPNAHAVKAGIHLYQSSPKDVPPRRAAPPWSPYAFPGL